MLDRTSRARLEATGQADVTHASVGTGALRIHASRGRKGPRLAIRLLAESIPNLRELGLPSSITSLVEFPSGLVLVAGPPRSGKSTVLAGLVERLNQSQSAHIVALETSSEHSYRWEKSVVSQYEVGRDVSSIVAGLQGALRSDTDILVIGDVQGIEIAAGALQAAEAGFLVLAAMRSPAETATAISRLVALFPIDEQEPVRHRFADAVRAIAALRLVPSRDRRALRPAVEILIVTDAIRRLFRDGAVHQVRPLMSTLVKSGSQTLERHLNELIADREISAEDARKAANHPNEIIAYIGAQ
jgi:twitching motility protein PilT